ncbi:MAG: thioredoxin family protein [Kofleriaceae bacterium]
MRPVVVVLFVWIVLASPAPAEPMPSLDAALETANTAGKPLVLMFTATWCIPCHELERLALPDPDVVQRLRDVHFVRYDIDTPIGGALAARFGVSGIPTFVVVAADGS